MNYKVFDDSLYKDVLKHGDIVKVVSAYLPVIRKGKSYVAKCPFHDDTNPSMHISPKLQIFKCFVCGTSGNAISFVKKYAHLSTREALKKVAEICNYHDDRLEGIVESKVIDPKRVPLTKCLHDLTVYYQYALNSPEGKEGLDYFNSRKLDAEIRSKFLLGYAYKDGEATCRFLLEKGHSVKTIEDVGIASSKSGTFSDRNQGRVIFPISDINGEVVGYSARRLGEGPEAKYVNSPETYLFHKSDILYNYHNAKEKARIAGYVYVLEGFMDVYALYRINIEACVAMMGTALSEEHIRLLRALGVEVRLCLDGDLAGQKASMNIAETLVKNSINVRIVDSQNNNKDPDEILNTEGERALNAYLNKLIPYVDFVLNYFQNTNPLQTTEQKTQLIQEFVPILLSIRSQLELDSYINKLANITGYTSEAIRNILKTAKTKPEIRDYRSVIMEHHPERKILRRLNIAERELLYQMLKNKHAVAFYEGNIDGFYDSTYRLIANFLIEYAQNNENFVPTDLISSLENSDLKDKEAMINQITELYLERNHPKVCDDQLLNNLEQVIKQERERIFEKDLLEQSIENKDPLEQARIISDYNRRKMRNK
ncbi:MAG TPA: DNA primase [Erysipelotrichaceae bacterium]|nr:DNA primase [Erysipelotrichaceae bacterium]